MATSSIKLAKLLVLFTVGLCMLMAAATLRPYRASARIKDKIEELASYRTWTRVTKEPIRGDAIRAISSIEIATIGGG